MGWPETTTSTRAVELLHDVDDRAGNAGAFVVVALGVPPSWISTTMASTPFAFNSATCAFTVSASSREFEAGGAGGRNDPGVPFKVSR